MASPRIADKAVKKVFDAMSPGRRDIALALRALVYDTARRTPGVGKVKETMRWQQPSYVTSETGSGSTIRIDRVKESQQSVALFFHCQSGLVGAFRQRYGEKFTYGGERCLVFERAADIDEEAVRHCLALALTHHLRKRKRG